MTIEEFKRELTYALDLLQELRKDHEGRETYVVANETYVHCREGKGLNDTNFCVITPFIGRYASIFYGKIDAEERGMDYNLIDGRGKKVELKIIKVSEFYSFVIDDAQSMLNRLSIATE